MDESTSGSILVLAGGLSHERDVSLRSGRRVAEALRDSGQQVVERDVDADLLSALSEDRPRCVIPMLHGETGEDGAVREVLEVLGLDYVGARPAACRITFDKSIAKTVVTRAGLDTPESICLPHETFRELGAAAVVSAVVAHLDLPLMIKPSRGGSALGCSVVREAAGVPGAMVNAYAYGPVALIERYVEGIEVAVTVLETPEETRALPIVEVLPDGGIYDYTARYTAGATRFVVPAELDPETAARCAEVALTAHRALGLRDLSRSDLIVDAEGRVWFLEANVAPGFTETSLVPLALQAAGLDLGRVWSDLVSAATGRAARGER